MQDCSISSALAMEILQSCIKPSSHKELDKSLQNASEVCLCYSLTILFIIGFGNGLVPKHYLNQLEQPEHLRSDVTLRRHMITHTIDSYWIPNQNKTKLQI